jgi:hypothetical protein
MIFELICGYPELELANLSGVAAILRFPLPQIEDLSDEEDEPSYNNNHLSESSPLHNVNVNVLPTSTDQMCGPSDEGQFSDLNENDNDFNYYRTLNNTNVKHSVSASDTDLDADNIDDERESCL